MASTQTIFTLDRQLVELTKAMDAVLASSGPVDLCRQIVHAGFAEGLTRSCALYYLDNKSTLKLIASYGKTLDASQEISAWDNCPLSEALREKRIRFGNSEIDGASFSVLALPFCANGVPIGLVSLLIDYPNFEIELPVEFEGLISKLGAFYLDTLDFGNMTSSRALAITNPEDLTTRQLNILGHIESGLVNIEIAKILMLSESTIRQETVRIYRALGVGNRQEAVKKAKALGLLARRITAPSDS